MARGREVTSYASIRTDLINAGGKWRDAEVVVDRNLVTSRKPEVLPAFIAALMSRIVESRRQPAA